LGACLAQHSKLGGTDESYFLYPMAQLYYRYFQGLNRRNWRPLRAFVDEHGLIEAMGTFADSLFRSFLDRIQKDRFVDHTPWYAMWMDFIVRLYPNAQFIHIIRDGRSVVESLGRAYEQGYWWAGESINARALLWKTIVSTGRESGAKLGPSQYREISYEHLCESSYSKLEELLAFLSLPMEHNVLLPLAIPHASPSRSGFTLAEVDANGVLRLRPKVTAKGWPRQWTPRAREVFAEVAIELMLELQYCDSSEGNIAALYGDPKNSGSQ